MTWDGEWCEAPGNASEVWPARLEPLRSRPGEWARFGPFALDSTRRQVRRILAGKYGAGFVAKRRTEAHQDWIYVCFEAAA